MAVAVDGTSPARWTANLAAAATMDSASFTAPANSFFALNIECDGDNDSNYTNGAATPSVSLATGTALTWTKRVERTWSETTAGGQSVWWTAPAVTSEARVVRITKDASSVTTKRTSAKLYVLTGVDISGTPVDTVSASNEGGSGTNNLTTTSVTPGANGLLLVADCDFNQLGVFTSSDLTIDTADYAGAISVCSGYKACTSGAGVTANLNAGGTGTAQHKWTQIVVREAAGGGTAFDRSLTDTVGTSDAFARLSNANRSYTQNLGVSDSTARLANALRAYTDTLGASDVFARTASGIRLIPESLGLADAVLRVSAAKRSIPESAGVSDAFARLSNANRSYSDTLGLADAILRQTTAKRALTDNAGVSDAYLRQLAHLRRLTDTMGLSDTAATFLVVAGFLTISVADALGLHDTVQRRADALRALADTLGAADALLRQSTALRAVSDSLALVDSMSRQATYSRLLVDSLALIDAAALLRSGVGNVIDNRSGTGAASRNATATGAASRNASGTGRGGGGEGVTGRKPNE